MVELAIIIIVIQLLFLATIQHPFDNVYWDDEQACMVCGFGSVAIGAITFGLSCATKSLIPVIIGATMTAIGFVSIYVRSVLIRRQERQKKEMKATIRGPALSLPPPLNERPDIILKEEEEYESIF